MTSLDKIQHVNLRKFVRLVLEDSRQMGDILEKEEEEALTNLTQAKINLKNHDDEAARRAAFEKRVKSLGYSLTSSAKAVKDLRAQPEFQFRPTFANTNQASQIRKNLEAAVEKAQRDYDAFSKFQKSQKPPVVTQQPQFPDKSSKIIFPIEQVTPMSWYSWSDKRWAKHIKEISYGASGDKSGEEQSGTGPGEERLAKIFGGKVQGGGVSFDVVTPDGARWEVKALESASALVRPGAEGRVAIVAARKRLDKILTQIKDFVEITNKLKIEMLTTDSDQINVIEYASEFLHNESDMIAKGEIPKERWREIMKVLRGLARVKRSWELAGAKNNKVKTAIKLNNKNITVDKPTFIDVAKRIQKFDPSVDVLNQFAERELALATLRDDAFNDPKEFINNWFDSVDIDHVFSQVDGVFIVNSSGFNLVPKNSFKSAFKLAAISQAVPKFKFVNYSTE